MAASDESVHAVRFVTGSEIAAVEDDDVLDPVDLWREGGASS